MRHFIWTPETGIKWYSDIDKWKADVESFDFADRFHDCYGEWQEEVENCIAGSAPEDIMYEIDTDAMDEDWDSLLQPYITHTAQRIDERPRPADSEIDEDGYLKGTGEYWGDFAFRCDYAFLPFENE